MVHSFMHDLQLLRSAFGRSMTISSGKRCEAHNEAVSTTSGPTAPHVTGMAADIQIYGLKAMTLIRLMDEDFLFTGLGVKQHGPHKDRFLHLDSLVPGQTKGPRPWAWSYP